MLLSFIQLRVIFTLLFTGPTGGRIVWEGQFHSHKALILPNMEMPGSLFCVGTSLTGTAFVGKEIICGELKNPLLLVM